jgi:hypothetical protein
MSVKWPLETSDDIIFGAFDSLGNRTAECRYVLGVDRRECSPQSACRTLIDRGMTWDEASDYLGRIILRKLAV